MKRKIFTMLGSMLMLLCLVASCQDAKLDMFIDARNEDCPEELDKGMTLTKVEKEGDYLVFVVELDGREYNMAEVRSEVDALKEQFREIFTQKKENKDEISPLEAAQSADKGIKVRFCMNGEQPVDVTFLPSEVKAGLPDTGKAKASAKESASQSQLESVVELMSINFHGDLGDGMKALKVAIEGDYVVFYFEVAAKDFAELKSNPNELRKDMRKSLIDDPDMKDFARIVKEDGKGVIFRFTTADGDKYDITVQNAEM